MNAARHPDSVPAAHAVAGYTAFLGDRRIASGAPEAIVRKLEWHRRRTPDASVLVFDDRTGAPIDLGPREVGAQPIDNVDRPVAPAAAPRSPGRPRLGVVAREVTLLPRHWEWLNAQPGGASVALRKLVDEARRTRAGADASRAAQERTYRFLQAIAGDRPHYEEALRALFAGRRADFDEAIAGWPTDIRSHAHQLAEGAWTA